MSDREVLQHRADAAALMLAAAYDREAYAATLHQLDFYEAAQLMLSAIEVGATLVNLTDRAVEAGDPKTAREVLVALLESCRTEIEALPPNDDTDGQEEPEEPSDDG